MKDWAMILKLTKQVADEVLKTSIQPKLNSKEKMEQYAKATGQYKKKALFTIE